MNFIVLLRYIPIKITAMKYIIKPLFSGAVMGGAAIGVYSLIVSLLGTGYVKNLIATLVAILVAAVIYIAIILFTHTMSKNDILLLPSGSKIYRYLTKHNIYKGNNND